MLEGWRMTGLKINVGAGSQRLRDGYVTLDSDPRHEPDICALVPPLPFDADSVEAIYASHFIEHLDQDTANEFIRECYRVLVPGGELEILTPYALCDSAWQDPTHKSFWVPQKMLYYTSHFDYLGYDHLERRFEPVDMRIQPTIYVTPRGNEFTERCVHVRLRKPEGAT